jgi:hypothetical protein
MSANALSPVRISPVVHASLFLRDGSFEPVGDACAGRGPDADISVPRDRVGVRATARAGAPNRLKCHFAIISPIAELLNNLQGDSQNLLKRSPGSGFQGRQRRQTFETRSFFHGKRLPLHFGIRL